MISAEQQRANRRGPVPRLLRHAALLFLALLSGALIVATLQPNPIRLQLGQLLPLAACALLGGMLWLLFEHRSQGRALSGSWREGVESYRPLVENFRNNLYFYLHDPDGRFIYVSPSVRDVLGYEAEEFDSHFDAFLTSHPGNERAAEFTAMSLRGERPPLYELEVRHKGGELRWLQIAEGPLFSDDGKVIGIEGLALDITERVRMAERLRLNEARLLEAQRISRVGSWEWNMHSGDIYWSEEIYRLFGKDADFTPNSESFINAVHPDDREHVMKGVEVALMGGPGDEEGRYSMEYRLLLEDGELRYVIGKGRVFRDADGNPWRMVGTVEDISERVLTGNQLRRSNDLMAAVSEAQIRYIQGSGLSVAFSELLRQLMAVSHCSHGLIGCYLEGGGVELLALEGGRGELNSGEVLACSGTELERVAEEGRPRLLRGDEVRGLGYPEALAYLSADAVNMLLPFTGGERTLGLVILAGGEEADSWLFDFSAPILSTCSSLLLADASERASRQARDEVMRLNAELEQRVAERTEELQLANKELESFSYSVSHDLRAPLRGIDGFSHLLLNSHADQLDETGRDYLLRVRKASQRMGGLIDDLLNLSRVIRSRIRRVPLDLTVLVSEVLDDLREAEPERRVEVDIEQGVKVDADPTLLRAVLENMLGNAWKFTSRRDRAEISFHTRRGDQGEVIYCIKDNGAGFDMSYADKLFGAFQRLHSADEFEGSGIGLATVQRIIHRHGGRVWAQSEPDKGAEFCFTLGVEAQESMTIDGGNNNA